MSVASPVALARPLRLRSKGGLERGRKVTWLELFFDLVFVAAVSQVGQPFEHDYSLAGLGRYAMLFVLIWWAWHGHTTFATRFDTDDVLQRLLTLLQMFVAAVMAVNAKDALDGRDSAGFAAAYAVMRFVLVAQYVRARRIPESRHFTRVCSVGFGLAASIWLFSALMPAPLRFWLWIAALTVDVVTPLVTTRHLADVPPDAAHLPERFGLFTIILIGDAMVGVMRGMESQQDWSPAAASAAVAGMLTIFAMWWWYFDGAGGAEERPVRSAAETRRFQVWTYAHLPLYLGIGVTGIGISHVISVATVSRLHEAESWLLCGAAGVAMAAITTIAASRTPASQYHGRHGLSQYGLAVVTVLLGWLGTKVAPEYVIVSIAGLWLLQLGVSMRRLRLSWAAASPPQPAAS